ncbi:VWA domain-containing protein [Lysobacter zhanggongensis]|uniref:VWA domain-containing protein n=1 Tax=Lysobacter zhanggongensis TaxID=1774951 RepID=A0ABU7YPZ3_9GAMM
MNASGLAADLAALHFLRPAWLWALLALPLLAMWWRSRRRRASIWREAVDPHLLQALLGKTGGRAQSAPALIAALGWTLAVVALAGPSWRQVEQPLWQSASPLVIALDLSGTVMAADVPPSRLAQARAKVATLLAERDGGQVGLVAFADDAFTVAPLTPDAANVALFLDALHPGVMPVDGQRLDRAIAWSTGLLRQAGFDSGDILVLTDDADAAARDAAANAAAQGYRVSALGVGSTAGAPYRLASGGFATVRLDPGSLRELAAAGGGRYATITSDLGDLDALGVLEPRSGDGTHQPGERGRSWQDGGFWLLPPLMLLALLAFRRGAPAVMLVLVLWWPGRVAASDLWQRPDQRAYQQMQQAAEAYRNGDFDDAAERYAQVEGADADYNRGNALAKAGHYPQAIEAYEEALRQDPGMEDAIANKRAVEAAMNRQPPQGPQSGQQDGDDDSQQPGDGQGSPGGGRHRQQASGRGGDEPATPARPPVRPAGRGRRQPATG